MAQARGLLFVVLLAACGGGQKTDDLSAAPPSDTATDPMPSLATDATTLGYAKQACAAAKVNDCDASRMLLAKVAARDHTYYVELIEMPQLAPCK